MPVDRKTANIRTKSIYDPPEPADGRRVLATRYWPRGLRKDAVSEYARGLSPSPDMIRGLKQGEVSWGDFRSEYLNQMRDPEARAEIQRLAELAAKETVTIMCVCRDEQRCHRSLLRELVGEEAKAPR